MSELGGPLVATPRQSVEAQGRGASCPLEVTRASASSTRRPYAQGLSPDPRPLPW